MYTNVLYGKKGERGVINLRAGVFFWEGESDGQIVM